MTCFAILFLFVNAWPLLRNRIATYNAVKTLSIAAMPDAAHMLDCYNLLTNKNKEIDIKYRKQRRHQSMR